MATHNHQTKIYKSTDSVIGIDTEQEAENKSDFETNYKSSCIVISRKAEIGMVVESTYPDFKSFVAEHGAWTDVQMIETDVEYTLFFEHKVPDNTEDDDGTLYVRRLEAAKGKIFQMKGCQFIAVAGETTEYAMVWDEDIEIIGGRAYGEFVHHGDKGNMKIVDKDNILGYGANTVLIEFTKDIPGKMIGQTCMAESPDATPLLAGLYVVITYENTHETEDTNVYCVFRYYH